MKRTVSALMLSVFVMSVLTLAVRINPAKAATITVPDNYATIQEAINAVSDGYIINVKVGTYYENVVINKKISLVGEDASTTIIDGGGNGDVVLFTAAADTANISSFTIRNGRGLNNGAGINVQGSSYHTIIGNMITDNEFGLRLYPSHRNLIFDNEVTSNIETGVELRNSLSNSILNNTISENGLNLWAVRSSNNTIANNHVTKGGWGISLTDSFNNTLRTNDMSDNRFNFAVSGILSQYYYQDIDFSNLVNGKAVYYLVGKENQEIDTLTTPEAGFVGTVNCRNVSVKNLALGGNADGILLVNTNDSLIEGVRINSVSVGIDLEFGSSNNTIKGNVVLWSEMTGIYLNTMCCNNSVYENEATSLNSAIRILGSSNSNLIYHNTFIQYYPQQISIGSTNSWDDGCEGNYWSDYSGNDADHDGIGDIPYIINSSNQDNYPLMSPYIPGDVNHDGTTNVFDAVKIVIAYNSSPSSPDWNPHCDLNKDGVINIFDLVVVAVNFGKQWPQP